MIFLLTLFLLFDFNILLFFFVLLIFRIDWLFFLLFKEFLFSIINRFLLLSMLSDLFFNFFKSSSLCNVNFINKNIFLFKALCSFMQKIIIPIKLINIAPKMQSAHKFLRKIS